MFEDTFSKIVSCVNHEVMGNGGCYRMRHLVISIAVAVLSRSQVKGHAAHIGWIRNAYRILEGNLLENIFVEDQAGYRRILLKQV
jgi:hypothetical protein